jgi:hypothetical protein
MLADALKVLVKHTIGIHNSTLTTFRARLPETIEHFILLSNKREGESQA